MNVLDTIDNFRDHAEGHLSSLRQGTRDDRIAGDAKSPRAYMFGELPRDCRIVGRVTIAAALLDDNRMEEF